MRRQTIRFVAILAVGITLVLTACGISAQHTIGQGAAVDWRTLPRNASGYRDISVEQLVALMEHEPLTLVNTHIPYEGEIPGTTAHIPYNAIAANLDRIPADKDAAIVVYCRSGSMSASAGSELAQLGYSNVLELDGGMRAWERSGRDLAWR